jgi:hypothetical protein
MAALSRSPALCALLAFVGLALMQVFLARRVTLATRDAMMELRTSVKQSFQFHHASLEVLAKMIRSQPGERISIELPHAPEFAAAPHAAALSPVAPPAAVPLSSRAPMQAEVTGAEPIPARAAPDAPSSERADTTPTSQRPTIAMVESEASRPTVTLAAKHGGRSAALEAIEAAAQGTAAPAGPICSHESEDDHTHVMRRPPEPTSVAPITPTRISAQTPAAVSQR